MKTYQEWFLADKDILYSRDAEIAWGACAAEYEHALRNKEAALKLHKDAFQKLKKQSDATYIEGCRVQGELNSLTELNSHNERVIETQKSAIAHQIKKIEDLEFERFQLSLRKSLMLDFFSEKLGIETEEAEQQLNKWLEEE